MTSKKAILILILLCATLPSCVVNRILIDKISRGELEVVCFMSNGFMSDRNNNLVALYDSSFESDGHENDLCYIYNLDKKPIGCIWNDGIYTADGSFHSFVGYSIAYRRLDSKDEKCSLVPKDSDIEKDIISKMRNCQLGVFNGERHIESIDDL